MSHRIILGSTSPYRRALLERLGFPFEVQPSSVDETLYRHLPPAEMATTLAREKAVAVARLHPGALVIGSDQVVATESDVFEKPNEPGRAVAQLSRLAGRAHQLITAVAVTDGVEIHTACDVHTLWMRPLTLPMLEYYVSVDSPLDCAGSYRLEGLGIALFDRIEADPETADDTAVIGLPLMKTLALLRRFGFDALQPSR